MSAQGTWQGGRHQAGRMSAFVAERQAASARMSDGTAREDALLAALDEAQLANLAAQSGTAAGTERWTFRARHLFTVALFGMFALGLMLAMAAGTGAFRTLRALDAASSASRMTSGLIANAVHATDATDSMRIDASPEGDMLVLVEHLETGEFETRIYCYRGSVVQEYALADAPLDPTGATPIVESATFDATFDEEHGLLSITTDEGTTSVALRSRQGDAS